MRAMNKLAVATLFMAVMVAGAPAGAQELWQGTKIGMSPEQVLAVVPKAAPPESKPSTLNSGAIEKLRIPRVEISGTPFVARFYFDATGLVQVRLAANEFGDNVSMAGVAFDTLLAPLQAKYGPTTPSRRKSGFLELRQAEWVSGRTSVKMIMMAVGNKDPILDITYDVSVAAEADKL